MLQEYLDQCNSYFAKNESILAEKNWRLMKFMSLLYLFFLLGFYFFISVPMGVTGQNNIAFLAIILQLVFTIAVWIRKSIPAKEKEVSLYLITFGLMILIPTMILGTIVFPEHEANLFPLIIVLMGQIYTIRPRQIYIMNLLVSVLFLILSYRLKTYGVFMQDLVSILSTNSITIVCCTVCMHSRLEIDNKEHDLKQMCSIDRMTGLLNKTTFESKYNEYRNSRVQGFYALAVMDMDGFKNVNDQYGHRVGDQVLLFFSELLETCFSNRRQSTIGRFGGDEFVVLLKGETDEEWIRQEFEHLSKEFSVKGQERFGFPVSCSIGVTITSKIPPSFASCFIIADRALYSAKKNHGNVCEFVRLDSDDNMRPTMLVVDDDEMTRTLLKTYFKDSFQIIEADNGQDALAEMESYQDMLSIVLMDLEMPVMDGRAVLEELHQMKQLCDIPVLVVTASTDNEMNLRDLGVAGVLNKPFQPEEIKRTVEQTLLA